MGTIRWLVALATWILLVCEPSCVHGVSCWAEHDSTSATCGLLVAENVTVEECCRNIGESVSWSTVDDISPEAMLRYQTIFGGVPECHLCEIVSCWAKREEGSATCGLLVAEHVTKEECCKNNGESISWSTIVDISPGEMFRYETIYGGVPDCHLCEKTCDQTICPDGRKCVMKSGRPRCVCKPDCTHNSTSRRGSVCATNGRQYKSMCALLKMKCRQEDHHYELDVAYYGPCQNSCDSVQCIGNKCCVEDQHGRPHCVSYSAISCPGPFRDEFVCGADGVTYETLCQLRRTSCSRGNIIPVAYEGKCEGLASCNDTRCVKNKQCFWDKPANTSRCILCNYTCSGWADEVAVCASDGLTYQSWCAMQEHICQTGIYVELVSWGTCDPDGNNGIEPGSGDYRGYDLIYFTPSSRQVLSELRSNMYRSHERDSGNATTTEVVPTTTQYGTGGADAPAQPVTGVASFLQGLINKGVPNPSGEEDDQN
ncbi:follistatin-A-like [Patiria miniata]|uniref:Kazal-like domain-containing protein n=1 Tax=Patiria miniata TaxID=46514 RepID=A0A914BEY6_PATMI|nr:follistatin-A-like [Patiria miniata]